MISSSTSRAVSWRQWGTRRSAMRICGSARWSRSVPLSRALQVRRGSSSMARDGPHHGGGGAIGTVWGSSSGRIRACCTATTIWPGARPSQMSERDQAQHPPGDCRCRRDLRTSLLNCLCSQHVSTAGGPLLKPLLSPGMPLPPGLSSCVCRLHGWHH